MSKASTELGMPELSDRGTWRPRLQERALSCDSILAKLAPCLVDVPSNDLDDAIEDAERTLCAHFGVGLWRINAASGEFWSTPLAREMLGLSIGGDLVSQDFLNTACLEERAGFERAVARSLDAGEALRHEYRVGLPDQSARWVMTRGQTQRNQNGEVIGLAGIVVDITDRKEMESELCRTLGEVSRLQERLRLENAALRKHVHRDGAPEMIGGSAALKQVIQQAEQVATTDSTVLVLGETGTGKELLAQLIHNHSRRASKPFITINTAAIPATLLESELFGREKGAYTGALTREVGRFELANSGTLFLDEIGEMPMETQAKLLRVLQTGEFERLGSSRLLRADVRIIAATNRSLQDLIKADLFRRDLFYRLNVFPLTLPPLRDRAQDIPALVWEFVKELSRKMGRVFDRINPRDLSALAGFAWPGNVRELRNIVERSMILCEGPELRLVMPDSVCAAEVSSSRRLIAVQREHVLRVLVSSNNRIHGHGGAAEILGLKPSTLYSLMGRLKIPRSK